jgi:hypothetical protein
LRTSEPQSLTNGNDLSKCSSELNPDESRLFPLGLVAGFDLRRLGHSNLGCASGLAWGLLYRRRQCCRATDSSRFAPIIFMTAHNFEDFCRLASVESNGRTDLDV